MHIYVLLKRTFDPEEDIIIDDGGEILDDGVEYIINPYDEYAIEEAIKQREIHGGEVTVITVGPLECEGQLRTALAMGADRGVLIEAYDELPVGDAETTVQILEKYFTNEPVDLILAGNVSIDEGSGQLPPRLAAVLNIPYVTSIIGLDIDENHSVTIEKDVEGDVEIIETSIPLLVSCQQGLNEPRYPSLPGIMKAKRKPLDVISLDDLSMDQETLRPKTVTKEIFLLPEKDKGQILKGSVDEQVEQLMDLLKNKHKVI